MRSVLRAGAFVIGIVGALAVLTIMDDTFPWFWLPLLLGLAVSVVIAANSWLRATRLSTLFGASLASGISCFYTLSANPSHLLLGRHFPLFARLLGFIVFLVFLLPFLRRGFAKANTRAMAAWFCVPITAVCVIGYVSGGIGGSDHMLHWLMAVSHLPKERAEVIVHYFRKTIHVCAYGALGLTLFRGAIAGAAKKASAFGFAMGMVFCIASFDEIRQTTAPNRTGSAWDVALDMTGALIFVSIASLFVQSSKSSRQPAPIKG